MVLIVSITKTIEDVREASVFTDFNYSSVSNFPSRSTVMKSIVPSPSGFSLLFLKSLRGLEDNAEDNRLYARNPIGIASLRPSQLEEFVKETITVSKSDAAWLPEKFLNQKPVYLDQEASNSQEEEKKRRRTRRGRRRGKSSKLIIPGISISISKEAANTVREES